MGIRSPIASLGRPSVSPPYQPLSQRLPLPSPLNRYYRKSLTWTQHIEAVIGVAKGIQYLHAGIVPGVYSNNLKITDVLLDQNFVAKIKIYDLPLLSLMRKVGQGNPSREFKSPSTNKKKDNKIKEVDTLKDLLQGSITTDGEARRSIIDPAVRKVCLDQSLKTMMEICVRCLVKEPAKRPSNEDVLWNLQFAAQVQDAWVGDSQSGSDDSLIYTNDLPLVSIQSLCKASEGLKKGKGTTNVYVDGCVYMLQVWFFEHFVPPEGPIDKFPRILHWMNRTFGDKFVKRCMETGLVLDDVYVGASTKDKKEYRPTPTRKDAQPTPKKIQKRNRRETFMRALEDQEFLIEELKRRVAGLEAQLAEEKARRKNKDHGGENVPRTEPSMNTGFVSPTDIDTNQQLLKTYVRVGSRRRY
ncbi:hypothetical protein LR48_Vigan10g215800 [Vigna angularis]|uniref:Protein kinase domain-containing protein n=1 Tax=Phaseolus angularis TaxID=3914 RepID=A0A0L9VMH3_PHAAN|nr:hypothetical protein LR48_Vigan10g215800 [Vigna angularis]